jgi:hypothetical protein
MDELFFGLNRRRSSPARKRRVPVRRASPKRRRSPMRRRLSPRRRRASPKRRRSPARMCTSKMSLSKLRKLAMEHGIDVYSAAKTAVSKRTGLPKKPKMVGCSTLMKRLKEAGLDHLYKVRGVKVDMEEHVYGPDMPEGLFDDSEDESEDEMHVAPAAPVPKTLTKQEQVKLMQADPACAEAFQKHAEKLPNNREQAKFLKEYKGYAMGPGPCGDKRGLVPRHIQGSDDPDELADYADVAGFDMSYGRRYAGGARPRKSHHMVGHIVVKGRHHEIFQGVNGGLFYLKGKKGDKVYIDPKRLKSSPKRKKSSPKRRKNKYGYGLGQPSLIDMMGPAGLSLIHHRRM